MTQSDCPVDSQGVPVQKLVHHNTLTIPVRVTAEGEATSRPTTDRYTTHCSEYHVGPATGRFRRLIWDQDFS